MFFSKRLNYVKKYIVTKSNAVVFADIEGTVTKEIIVTDMIFSNYTRYKCVARCCTKIY